jgi:dethiobiotin synthetase
MSQSIFITATDTDAGKTLVAESVLLAANQIGLSTLGYKPVAAGCEATAQGLRNQDALTLQHAASIEIPYEQVNPIAFAEPVAPHLAARRCGEKIDLKCIQYGYVDLCKKSADLLLIEGAGGWRLPLGDGAFMSDFVIRNEIPVILVIGLKLGCLNHALLTYESLQNDGVKVLGWIANQIDPNMLYLQDNIDELHSLIDAPCLGVIPHLTDLTDANQYVNFNPIFNPKK